MRFIDKIQFQRFTYAYIIIERVRLHKSNQLGRIRLTELEDNYLCMFVRRSRNTYTPIKGNCSGL